MKPGCGAFRTVALGHNDAISTSFVALPIVIPRFDGKASRHSRMRLRRNRPLCWGPLMSAKTFLWVAGLVAISAVGAGASAAPQVTTGSPMAAGRYLVVVTGCNHCHTEGWQESNGHVPEARWLNGGHAPPNVPTPNLRTMVRAM